MQRSADEIVSRWTLSFGRSDRSAARRCWAALVRGGGWAIGAQEHHALSTELGESVFPLDYPGSAAGDAMWALLAMAGDARDARRPPSKRAKIGQDEGDARALDESGSEEDSEAGSEEFSEANELEGNPTEEAARGSCATAREAPGDGALLRRGVAPPPSFVSPLSSQARPPWEALFSPPPSRGAFCVVHDGADALGAHGADAAVLVRVRIAMQRRGTPKPCATLYAAAGPDAVVPIGFVTSGQYSERRGRGVAIAFVTRSAALRGDVLGARCDARCGVLLRNPGKESALRPAWMRRGWVDPLPGQ